MKTGARNLSVLRPLCAAWMWLPVEAPLVLFHGVAELLGALDFRGDRRVLGLCHGFALWRGLRFWRSCTFLGLLGRFAFDCPFVQFLEAGVIG